MKLMNPSQFQKIWGYKYVCFKDGTVLFTDGANASCSHLDLVNGHPNLIPTSAGTIKIKNKKWKIIQGGSVSANLNWSQTDKPLIEKLLSPLGYVYDSSIEM